MSVIAAEPSALRSARPLRRSLLVPAAGAACLIAGLVWAFNEHEVDGYDVRWVAWTLTVFAGLTMVSNLKFYSGKDINLRKSVSFTVVVGIALGLLLAERVVQKLVSTSLDAAARISGPTRAESPWPERSSR